ncbi:asparagine synthase [Nocardia abscessus]|uniref:asparagine synthase-related protein n=1 Tax=Nocardia abscessus TaxID=120957 RepID=UPI0018932AD5|nr:asparagine synthetase B family protein [Nocardia abscessus]MBF6339789.1 asparagine synthase [Nocardia abscessus]
MSSLTISVAGAASNAHRDVMRMTEAMTDRSPAWAVVGESAAASAAVGGENEEAARAGLRLLDNGIRLAIAGPEWLRRELDPLAQMLDSPDFSLEMIAAILAGVSGDAHCAALVGSRCAVVYRSPMSARPLFYAIRSDRTVLIASRIRGIRAALPAVGIDMAGLGPFLVPAMCDPSGTAWEGVRRLPPGHALIVRYGRVTVREMPPLEALDIEGAVREDLVAEFRRRLLTAVERNSGPPDAVLLSGGIDSASLTCAAKAAGLKVRAFSLTYSSPSLAACDERRFVDDVERSVGVPVTRMPADHLLPLLADYPIGDEPEAWTYAARNSAMLRRITSNGSRVSTVIAGEGGDELLLGQIFAVADRHARGDTGGAARELATFPDPVASARIVDGLLAGSYNRHGTRVIRALADIPPWLSSRYLADTGLADRLADGYPQLTQPGHLTIDYSRALIAEAGAAGRVHCGGWWEDVGRRAGLNITYPFLDPDLATLTWSLPPNMLRDNGIEKVILRDALTNELPDSIAARADKADARAMMHAGLRQAPDQLRCVAHGGPLVDHAVVDPSKLLTAINEYLAGDDSHGPGLWATVAVNTWMSYHEGDAPS